MVPRFFDTLRASLLRAPAALFRIFSKRDRRYRIADLTTPLGLRLLSCRLLHPVLNPSKLIIGLENERKEKRISILLTTTDLIMKAFTSPAFSLVVIGTALNCTPDVVVVRAALPPGYEDEMWCPPDGYCSRRPPDVPDDLAGPASTFNECYNPSTGEVVEEVWTGSLTDVAVPEGWVQPEECTIDPDTTASLSSSSCPDTEPEAWSECTAEEEGLSCNLGDAYDGDPYCWKDCEGGVWTHLCEDAGPPDVPDDTVGMANPASVHCEENGGTVDVRTEEAGEYGVCLFEDGSECEEFEFLRGECNPGDSLADDCKIKCVDEVTGASYVAGDSFLGGDGCNRCSCSESGGIGCSKMMCGDTCVTEGYVAPWGVVPLSLRAGESFTCSDGCNTCNCNEDGTISSTFMTCNPECSTDEDCTATIRSRSPTLVEHTGVGVCECYGASTTADPFVEECEGEDDTTCLVAKCAGDACKCKEAICDAGLCVLVNEMPEEPPTAECTTDDDCFAKIRSRMPTLKEVTGVDMCDCYSSSSIVPFDECEGEGDDTCPIAGCVAEACDGKEAICDAGTCSLVGTSDPTTASADDADTSGQDIITMNLIASAVIGMITFYVMN